MGGEHLQNVGPFKELLFCKKPLIFGMHPPWGFYHTHHFPSAVT